MDTISKDKGRIWDSLQFKFGLSYILIIAGVLLLLNTYPLRVSQDLVFRSKATTLQSSVSVMVYSLSGLDRLTEENVSQAMAVVEETGLSRILVTDSAGKVLYDTRETNDALGEYSFYTEIVQALLGNDVFSSSYRDGAFRSRAASPVLYQNQIIGAVYAYEYDTEQAALLEGLQGNLLRLSAGIAVVVLCLSGLLSRALTRKIGQLLTAIREVREGAYSHRAEVPGRDEIAQLAQEFNSLTDRLQTTENARRRFVSDASHELKTPLAAIRLLTDSILQTENIDRETAREFVTDIGQEAERLSRITEDLLRLTRLDSNVLERPVVVDALPVLEQVMRMMSLVAQEKGTELTYRAEGTCTMLATRDEIHQIIYNLTDNAVKYTPPGSTVQVSLFREGDQVVLTVEDNGAGIPEEDLPRIFERFYRVDKARSRAAGGTGLGLAIVRDTVEKRGGTVEAANRPGGGSVRRPWRRCPAGGAAVHRVGRGAGHPGAGGVSGDGAAGGTGGRRPHQRHSRGDYPAVPGAGWYPGQGGPLLPLPVALRRGAGLGRLCHHPDADPAAGDLRCQRDGPGPAAGLPGPADLHSQGCPVFQQRGCDRHAERHPVLSG